jgi:hypothetical protein
MKPQVYRILRSFAFGLCGADFIITLQFITNDRVSMSVLCSLIVAMPILLTSGAMAGVLEEVTTSRSQRDYWLLCGFIVGAMLSILSIFSIFQSFDLWYGSSFAFGIMLSAVILKLTIGKRKS